MRYWIKNEIKSPNNICKEKLNEKLKPIVEKSLEDGEIGCFCQGKKVQ